MTTLREKIEGLERFDLSPAIPEIVYMPRGRYVPLAEVLRIVDEHESDVAQLRKEIAGLRAQLVPLPDVTQGGPIRWRSMADAGPAPVINQAPVGQAGGERTHEQHVARLRKDVEDRRKALDEAKRRTSLYDHEAEMLEVAEEELRQALADEEFRPSLPSKALRKAWPHWTQVDRSSNMESELEFRGERYRFAWWSSAMPDRRIDSFALWNDALLRPHGWTWAEVERMAGEAQERPWRRELGRLEDNRDNCATREYKLHDALCELATLVGVILSGKGDSVAPDGVAQYMPIDGGSHHPAGRWEPWGDRGDWAASNRSDGLYTADKEYILTAINAYGNALVGGGK